MSKRVSISGSARQGAKFSNSFCLSRKLFFTPSTAKNRQWFGFMDDHMGFSIYDLKVVNRVVQRVFIYMMDQFRFQKFPPKMVFHDKSVQLNPFPLANFYFLALVIFPIFMNLYRKMSRLFFTCFATIKISVAVTEKYFKFSRTKLAEFDNGFHKSQVIPGGI